ncbi:DNA polymerase B region [Escherichia phage EC.W2-6]|uniref:DNA polymerase B region n=1 Tax=Escherichia phage EC.W8-1 TaxID=3236638 RepID=A0AB39CBC7_9CAUD
MAIKEIKLSNGFSCFVGGSSILFNTLDGQITLPVITFCRMEYQPLKDWLAFADFEITREDFKSIYIDGDLSLANLLNHGLIKGDING